MQRATTAPDRSGAAYTGDVEIRIHGVSGTPPEELLDRATAERVSGDRVAGFYRPSATGQRRDVPRGDQPGSAQAQHAPWLEGYSWGGWTSGARSRALWLVLAPFALVNVAPRMLPPDPAPVAGPSDPTDPTGPADRPGTAVPAPRRSLRVFVAALIRLLAASLTVTLVLGVAAPMLTTVARRCAGGAQVCPGLPTFATDLLGGLSPSWQIGVAALVPLLLVGLLWWLSRSSADRYRMPASAALGGRPDDVEMPLGRADLWHAGVAGRRLRVLHVQIGLLTVTGLLAVLFPPSAPRTVAVVVAAASLASTLVLAAVRLRPGGGEPEITRVPAGARWVWLGFAVSVAADLVLVIGGAAVGADAAGLDPDRLVRSADTVVRLLFTAQAGLLFVVLVALTIALARGAGRGSRMFVRGYAGFVFALLAWLLGSMMTAAVLILVPAWLGTASFAFTPSRIAQVLAEHPTWFGDTTRSSGVGMLVAVAIAVLLLGQLAVRMVVARQRGGRPADRDAVVAEYGLIPTDYPSLAAAQPAAARRVREIGYLRWTARLVDGVPRGLAVFTAVIVVLLLLQLVATSVPAAERPSWLAFTLGQGGTMCDASGCAPRAVGAVAWGAYLTAGLLIGLLLLGVLAYRTPIMRRGVGVLWDLACFWPRDVHPFAPPCYNERIMPEVHTRIDFYTGAAETPAARTGAADIGAHKTGAAEPESVGAPDPHRPPVGRVLIAGHSQGSVIGMVAVLLADDRMRDRLSLVTFGCVLDRLYSRFFPRYFSPAVYAKVADTVSRDGVTRWVNLWRDTDYLAGSVPYPATGDGAAGVGGPRQVRFTDPEFAPAPGDVVYPVAGRHSAFWVDPEFQRQVAALFVDMPALPGRSPLDVAKDSDLPSG